MELSTFVITIIAGLVIALILRLCSYARNKFLERRHKKRVYKWLNENTSNKVSNRLRSTKDIASGINLTEDRERYICTVHRKIYLSTRGVAVGGPQIPGFIFKGTWAENFIPFKTQVGLIIQRCSRGRLLCHFSIVFCLSDYIAAQIV